MRLETRTWGAARPAPSYSAMVSSMSSMSRCTSGAPMPSGGTGAATRRSTGCPSRATRRTAMLPPCWQTGPPPASRLTARPAGPKPSAAVPSLADAAIAAGWALVALDNARRERREREARAAYGAVVAGLRRLPAPVRLLERRTGRWAGTPLVTAAGVLLVAGGAALHLRARRALGALWSDVIAVRARHEVVDHGPYARVRHPIYLGILLLAAGTVCAHPSPATICVGLGTAAGVALKIPLEERALRRTLGEAYSRYAARVPALVPRLLRRGRP